MKRIKFLSLLCASFMIGGTMSCSDDDDDKNNNYAYDEDENDDENGGDAPADDPVGIAESKNYNFYGGELSSNETFKYGKFEAKMKMAYAPGCISSMFLYYNNSYVGGTEVWNEIDIEVIGKQPNGFQSNIITGKAKAQITTEKIHKIGEPISSDYHIYTIEWTPKAVVWYLDGKEMRRAEGASDSKTQVPTLIKEQSLRFNIWSSESVEWVGSLNHKYIPVEQEIDYIKVYDYDEITGEFSERWTDEFETFDAKRWSKGNWRMENVMLSANNVVVEDGVLKLKLTKEKK